jgi:hypothetical protein
MTIFTTESGEGNAGETLPALAVRACAAGGPILDSGNGLGPPGR